MKYSAIRKCDVANGPGVRVSVFVSGCRHRCKGCFNPDTWDFGHGEEWTEAVEEKVIAACGSRYVEGLSLLGGEPFEPENQRALLPFLRKFRERLPGKTVWCWTGCVLERDLLGESAWRCEATDGMLGMVDVLVDGPYVEELRDISLTWCGSSNQRVLKMEGGAAVGVMGGKSGGGRND